MSTVKTRDGKSVEVGRFWSGGYYARTPDWLLCSHTYEATADSRADLLEIVAANHGGIKSVK
jgi:hypothetical protein